jgi:RimJ/RimL family protein N-acetyltransferase
VVNKDWPALDVAHLAEEVDDMGSSVRLRTDRLFLRPFSESDEAAFFVIESDPDIRMFLHGTGDEEASRRHLLAIIHDFTINGYGLLAFTLVGTGDVIGYGGLQPCDAEPGELEVLVGVLPYWRKQGFAGEALAELLRWAYRDLGRRRVLGVVRPDNTASLCLLSKAGARYVRERSVQWPGEPPELIYEFLPSSDDI